MAQYAPGFMTVLLSDYDCIVTFPFLLSVGGRRTYGLEHKPDPSPRTDGGGRSCLLQFFPQSGDVSIDDIGARIEMHVPHFVM